MSEDRNVWHITENTGKLAVWGVNYLIANLFWSLPAFSDDRVYPVDISSSKRMMDLFGKTIHPPHVIDQERIGTVVVGIPVYSSEIASRIRSHYPHVERIPDVCNLMDPDLKLPSAVVPPVETAGTRLQE
ncbi:MAG: hypothetical protein HQL63_01910 [Magnetococcales bacterium]|nr:hypothetical protein [Magnetococcales bacterium]MBF0321656.1 hypothetical protein [Magnetococcales bacterium]